MRAAFKNALAKAGDTKELSREDLIALIEADEAESAALFALADRVRQQFVGDEVHLRGIIEFSNYCANNCLYCGLRRENRQLPRYRMSMEEILAAAARRQRWVAGRSCFSPVKTAIIRQIFLPQRYPCSKKSWTWR